MKTLAVTICATRSYTYALIAQAKRLQACLNENEDLAGTVILVGDNCPEMQAAERMYRNEVLSDKWQLKRIEGRFADGRKNYKPSAQLIIARMRTAAFTEARRLGVDLCWSLDSDVLPQTHSLECMIQMLEFHKGYYGVSTCPYPSQGGGDFLGGRGVPQNPIFPSFWPDERMIPPELQKRMDEYKEKAKLNGKPPSKAMQREHDAITAAANKCQPRGDVYFLNSRTGVNPYTDVLLKMIDARTDLADELLKGFPAKSPLASQLRKIVNDDKEALKNEILAERERWKPSGFRRRGWLSAAYPGIGIGAIVPIDWTGFGCVLMGKTALAEAQFDGYDGKGTEDLYINYKRWDRKGIRINCITHAPVDHVIRNPDKKKGGFVLLQAYHEKQNPECAGHLRLEAREWFQQTEGEHAPRPGRRKK